LVLRSLVGRLTDAQASAKPSPTGWSVAETVAHLAHTEEHCYQSRVEHILHGTTDIVPEYDVKRFEAEGSYSRIRVGEGLARLTGLRTQNVAALRGLADEDLQRSAIHESVGPFTLQDLVYEWVAHDVGHIRQIAIVMRDVLYTPFTGPFRD
jgi:hypothetical protein